MGRVVAWLIMVVVGVAVMLFALANSHKTKLSLQPIFQYETPDLPVYLFVIGAIFVGFVAGGTVAWISGTKARRRARAMGRHIDRLEKEGAEMQQKIDRLQDAAENVEDAARQLETGRGHPDRLTGV
jgi:uncharacterized integral membrane protein